MKQKYKNEKERVGGTLGGIEEARHEAIIQAPSISTGSRSGEEGSGGGEGSVVTASTGMHGARVNNKQRSEIQKGKGQRRKTEIREPEGEGEGERTTDKSEDGFKRRGRENETQIQKLLGGNEKVD